LIECGYQCCILDPEGDYDEFTGTLRLGDGQRPPSIAEVMTALQAPGEQLVVNLLGLPLADRPAFFAQLLPRIQELRSRTGRPHWLVLDETHHLVPSSWQPATVTLSQRLDGLMLVDHGTQRRAARAAARHRSRRHFRSAGQGDDRRLLPRRGADAPVFTADSLERGEALLWRRGSRIRSASRSSRRARTTADTSASTRRASSHPTAASGSAGRTES